MKKIRKIQLTRSQLRVFILAAIVISLFLSSVIFILLPFHWRVRSLEAEVKTFFQESQKTQEMMLATNRSGEKFETTLEKLEKYRRMAPTPDILADALDRAGSNAEQFRLNLLSLKPKTDEKILMPDGKPFIDEGREARLLRVEMALRGSFFALGNYLTALEEAPYKIIVKELDIRNPNVNAQGTGASDLEIQMTLGMLTMQSPD